MATTTRNPVSTPVAVETAPTGPRKKRPIPERTAPLRQMTPTRRPAAPPNKGVAAAANNASPASDPAATTPDPAQKNAKGATGAAADLVKMGHELADAAIARTRKSAAQSAEAPHPETSILSELPSAKEALHLAEGALRTWVILWTSVIRATVPLAQGIVPEGGKIMDALRDLAGKALGEEPSSGDKGREGGAKQAVGGHGTTEREASFTMLVQSARPARISLQLHRDTPLAKLGVQPLFPVARDGGRSPITEVSLTVAKDGKNPEVSVIIPDTQPPGRYLGAVFDEASGSVVGGLTIDLLG